jgi:hypothetical protein
VGLQNVAIQSGEFRPSKFEQKGDESEGKQTVSTRWPRGVRYPGRTQRKTRLADLGGRRTAVSEPEHILAVLVDSWMPLSV